MVSVPDVLERTVSASLAAPDLAASRVSSDALAPVVPGIDETLRSHWGAYLALRDRAARNELLLDYAPLIAAAVRRLPSALRCYFEPDDLHGYGALGLVTALDRWDATRPLEQFPPFARVRIRGAIYDELRRLDWLPRQVRRSVINYRSTVEDLTGSYGRAPLDKEVFAALGVAPQHGRHVLRHVWASQLLHLDAGRAGEGSDTGAWGEWLASDAPAVDAAMLRAETLGQVRDALEGLPERERYVLESRYLGGRRLREVADTLGISVSRASQLEQRALERLRARLVGGPVPRAGATGATGAAAC